MKFSNLIKIFLTFLIVNNLNLKCCVANNPYVTVDLFGNFSRPLEYINKKELLEYNSEIFDYEKAENGLPILHSNASITNNVIFLDFDGYNNTGEDNYGWHEFYAAPYDPFNNDPNNYNPIFTETEQLHIINIWQRVSEDFAPFNVDITTEEPVFTDNPLTISHCLITKNVDIFGNSMPYKTADGVAYLNIFGKNSNKILNPALVYWNNIGSSNNIAETVSHEIGHHMGLKHDGFHIDGFRFTYYPGDSNNAVDSWAPIMGIGYSNKITQWNNGSYPGANNFQDDIKRLTDRLGLKKDDYPDKREDVLSFLEYPYSINGLISHNKDVDLFKFKLLKATDLLILINPMKTIINNGGYNLDINFKIYNSENENPIYVNKKEKISKIEKWIRLNPGIYYLAIYGSSHYENKYTNYGSLGEYTGNLIMYEITTTPPTTSGIDRILYGHDNIILSVISKVNCAKFKLEYDFFIINKKRKPFTFKIKTAFLNKKNKTIYNTIYTNKIKKSGKHKLISYNIKNLKINDLVYIHIKGTGDWKLRYFTHYLNQIVHC